MSTKKLKAWDSSKIPDAPYESKSMQDWIAVLQGHDVPECEPNNRAYAEAVRFGMISNNHGGVAPPTLKGEYIYERDGDIDEFNARLKKESEDE
tara:strand:+ start:83 stop:364 length:282 start_codon:yes stop_codon:yes gene_type:complete